MRATFAQTYDTFGSIFALYLTLSGNETLAKFTWLLEWPKLKDEEKRAKYSEFACHELNFFLSRKDPAFFAAVVQTSLRNKKDKTFIFGDYGNPSEVRFGGSWYFTKQRGLRLNAEFIHVKHSPVGYTAYPMPVGANANPSLADTPKQRAEPTLHANAVPQLVNRSASVLQ